MELSFAMTDIDLQLASKLKAKYPEHFQNLVRMHLSFALDLNVDERDEQAEKIKPTNNKWFNKKKNSKDGFDGIPLTEAGISRMYGLILFLCQEENLVQEGIFRKSGSSTRQQQLKTCLNEGVAVDFNENNFSVHDCATVLKSFLSELPEPLVTDAYYPLYCQISEWCKCNKFEARLLRSLQLLVLLLPSNNALLLKYVLHLLHRTVKFVGQNKMSASNLATIFIPHIICPKNSNPQDFHENSRTLCEIVVFMIENEPDLFNIPAGLAADIRLYWHEKEKKKLSPKNCLNESTADSCVVNTVFSFVDREKTAQENFSNPTMTALAQLYAHIQSLPESSKKRKLVKQFNKENGYGTPKRVLLNNDKSHSITRNISDSLKKHIFSKTNIKQDKMLKFPSKVKNEQTNEICESKSKSHPLKLFERGFDCMDCRRADISDEVCSMKMLPDDNDEDKPVDCTIDENLAETSFNYLDSEESSFHLECVPVHEGEVGVPVSHTPVLETCPTFLTPKATREITLIGKSSVHRKLSCSNVVHVTTPSSYFHGTLTSTPAQFSFSNDVLTPSPFCCSNDDMSPITMSAQKMPKSMQEVMMTPRSRRPVLTVSGSNTNLLAKDKSDVVSSMHESEQDYNKTTISQCDNFQTCLGSSKDQTDFSTQSGESLTDTFREYLYNRSILTASIADDSFSSRTGDFDPSSMSEDKMSDSLLYCLDGGAIMQDNSYDKNSQKFDESDIHKTLL